MTNQDGGMADATHQAIQARAREISDSISANVGVGYDDGVVTIDVSGETEFFGPPTEALAYLQGRACGCAPHVRAVEVRGVPCQQADGLVGYASCRVNDFYLNNIRILENATPNLRMFEIEFPRDRTGRANSYYWWYPLDRRTEAAIVDAVLKAWHQATVKPTGNRG